MLLLRIFITSPPTLQSDSIMFDELAKLYAGAITVSTDGRARRESLMQYADYTLWQEERLTNGHAA